MPTRTIHTLAYKLLVDSSQFERGMIASRSELAFAKREMRSTLTPAQRMEVALGKLGNIAKKDAKFQEIYNIKLQQYQKHLRKARSESSLFGKASGALRSKLVGVGSALAGAFAVGSVIRGVGQQIDRVDKLAKTADKLGIGMEELTRIQFVAGRVSGLSADQTAKGLEKMVRRTSEAAAGFGEAKGVLEEIGLSAQQLAGASPDRAFMMIARAMDTVVNKHDRLRIATKLFDDEQAGIHTTLALTNKQFAKQFGLADRLGATLNDIDASRVSAAKDAMTELNTTFQAFSTEFAVNLAPSLTQVMRELSPMLAGAASRGRSAINTNLTIGDFTAAATRSLGNEYAAARRMIGNLATIPAELSQGRSPLKSTFDSLFGDLKERGNGVSGFFDNIDSIQSERIKGERETARRVRDIQKEREQRENIFKLEAKTAKIDQQRKADMREAVRLVQSVQTAEEKHGSTIERLNELRNKGMLTAENHARLLRQNDQTLKDSLISRIDLPSGPTTTIGTRTTSSGPLQSIGAGSSAAFALTNRTVSHRQVEVEIARKQVSLAEKSLIELQAIAAAQSSNMPEGGVDG